MTSPFTASRQRDSACVKLLCQQSSQETNDRLKTYCVKSDTEELKVSFELRKIRFKALKVGSEFWVKEHLWSWWKLSGAGRRQSKKMFDGKELPGASRQDKIEELTKVEFWRHQLELIGNSKPQIQRFQLDRRAEREFRKSEAWGRVEGWS